MGRFINEIAADASRNLLASEAIAFLYDSGRDVLVLSDRIEHLREMLSLCYYGGIPQEEMGIYAGYTPSYGYGPEPTPSRRPDGYVRGLEYTPVSLQLISKRNSKPVLQKVKDTAKVIFATYGMFSKGVDVPRLGGGVDITPRSQAEQMQGRILRSVDGKQHPIWITIVDTQSYRSVNALAGRVPDYARNNADIYLWKPDKGLTLCDPNELKKDSLTSVKSLKSMQIETNSDGLNTLTTQRQQIEHVRRRVSATKRADPRRDD
jgi:hypothetical protein